MLAIRHIELGGMISGKIKL